MSRPRTRCTPMLVCEALNGPQSHPSRLGCGPFLWRGRDSASALIRIALPAKNISGQLSGFVSNPAQFSSKERDTIPLSGLLLPNQRYGSVCAWLSTIGMQKSGVASAWRCPCGMKQRPNLRNCAVRSGPCLSTFFTCRPASRERHVARSVTLHAAGLGAGECPLLAQSGHCPS